MTHGTEHEGILIAIEGIDGSGKGTHCRLLAEHLRQLGYEVAVYDFPRYGQPSAYFASRYLNGAYGGVAAVGPYAASLCYALDRFDTAVQLRDDLRAGKLVLANRFTASNMAHQGTKLADDTERRDFFIWLDNLEFELLRLPRPKLNLVLRMPAALAQQLVGQKAPRAYTGASHDIHEADLGHLERTAAVYDELCQLFPKDFTALDCAEDGVPLPIDHIQRHIRRRLQPLLALLPLRSAIPDRPVHGHQAAAARAVPAATGPSAAQPAAPPAGFPPAPPPATAQSAETVPATPADGEAAATDRHGNPEKTAAARQPACVPFIAEGISSLAAFKLAQLPGLECLELLRADASYENRRSGEDCRYYVPPEIDGPLRQAYCQTMDGILERYEVLLGRLREDYAERNAPQGQAHSGDDPGLAWARAVAGAVLPLAAQTGAVIFGTPRAMAASIRQLAADDLPESRRIARQLQAEAGRAATDHDGPEARQWPQPQDNPAGEQPPRLQDDDVQTAAGAELTGSWPRNELDLAVSIRYQDSGLGLRQLRQEADDWPYGRKAELCADFVALALTRPAAKPEGNEVRYDWDIVSSFQAMREACDQGIAGWLQWQRPAAGCGFDMPPAVERAGLGELFEECFGLSRQLHGRLAREGYANEAQYATLFGHRLRWRAASTIGHLPGLYRADDSQIRGGGQDFAAITNDMREAVGLAHPLISAAASQTVRFQPDPESIDSTDQGHLPRPVIGR